MSKFIDLTGQFFGNLEVLCRGDNYISPSGQALTKWKCLCNCGNITYVTSAHLKSKHTTSCGCMKNVGQAKKDLTGQNFGRLKVTKEFSKSNTGNIIWECRCECGNTTYVNSTNLIENKTQSCGCLHKEIMLNSYNDLLGMKFGRLIVIEKVQNSDANHIKWKCKCDCGTIIEVQSGNLCNGHTKSCGCLVSYGEELVSSILQENNFSFKKQFIPKDFRLSTGRSPRFDFIVYDKTQNYLIEYDGKTHFYFTNKDWNTEENFLKQRQRDLEKNEYCFNNNIPLIRIPYTHFKNITINDLALETSKFVLTKENQNNYYM